jgi:hypothetical protein
MGTVNAATEKDLAASSLRLDPSTKTPRTLRVGKHTFPVVLPSVRDPRLHLAAVIISIHVLGQVALGFQVSVVQILAAILTCAIIEVLVTLWQTGSLVWPASAMLTGSGVALIFRVIGTEHGDYWSWRGWYLFALVAGLSLLTKYVIRYRGSHVFNPSNVGLVAAFVILGSTRVEPLDFWWAPFDGWMAAAYLIILGGGLLITARLRLVTMSVAFWVTLAAGIGVLAASGHCMTARWSFAPVCGAHFWWVIVTSPEILIFLFFMITDPKTVPAGRVARVVFAVCVALASTLLIAPQTTEFGAKVALLGGLVVLCAARLVFERFLPAASADQDRLRVFMARLTSDGERNVVRRRAFTRGAVAGSAVVLLATGIVAAGAPARETFSQLRAEPSPHVAVDVDPSALPPVTVDPDVADLSSNLAGPGAQELAVSLAENLQIENEALLGSDKSLLTAADYGDRLTEMQRRIDDAGSSGQTVVERYVFSSLRLSLLTPSRRQSGLSLGMRARGTVEEITYDVHGEQTNRSTSPFALVFVLSQPTGDRWLIVDTRPLR